MALAVVVLLWLAASCGTHATYQKPPPDTCADRVVWYTTRLSDC